MLVVPVFKPIPSLTRVAVDRVPVMPPDCSPVDYASDEDDIKNEEEIKNLPSPPEFCLPPPLSLRK